MEDGPEGEQNIQGHGSGNSQSKWRADTKLGEWKAMAALYIIIPWVFLLEKHQWVNLTEEDEERESNDGRSLKGTIEKTIHKKNNIDDTMLAK
jgi:hypothetical protein